jgi:hypothetical protein
MCRVCERDRRLARARERRAAEYRLMGGDRGPSCKVQSGECTGFASTWAYHRHGRIESCVACAEAVKTTDIIYEPKAEIVKEAS